MEQSQPILEFPLAKDLEAEFTDPTKRKVQSLLEEYKCYYHAWEKARDEYNQEYAVCGDLYYKEKGYIYAKEQLKMSRDYLLRILQKAKVE
jgi:hypothetical protein